MLSRCVFNSSLMLAALNCVVLAQSNAAFSAGGVAYEIASRKSNVVAGGIKASDRAAAAGTGQLARDTQMTTEELNRTRETIALFAPYEVREGKRNDQGSFQPFSVIEPDERTVVSNTTAFPARATVNISFKDPADGLTYGCSGSMIANNTVLTAGHCVFNSVWHTDFVTYPGRNGGAKPFGSCSATHLFALQEWVTQKQSADRRLFDLGAIRLDCNIGEQTGLFGLRSLNQAETEIPTVVRGYPCDLSNGTKQYISEDKIRTRLPLKIFYQNDTFGCMSGAPVYTGTDHRVFAVHTNGLHNGQPWTSNNAGTRLTPERIELILTWIAN